MGEATEIILNPTGNHSRDGKDWVTCQREFLRRLAPAEVTLVETVAEAAQAARQSAMKGYRKIVSVGEGSTAHGVVNGVMELAEEHRRRLKIGFLSFARPSQWCRTLDLPRSLERQLEVLTAGHTQFFDVGRVEFQDGKGERTVRHFLNGATFGLSGHICKEWDDPETGLAETLYRVVRAFRQSLPPAGAILRLESEGRKIHEGHIALGMVMGGQYYPWLGRVAPHANPTDGLLELAVVPSSSPLKLLLKLTGLLLPVHPRGRALNWQAMERITITAMGGPVFLELDGQPLGQLPAQISMVKRAPPVIVAPVPVRLKKPRLLAVEKPGRGRLAGNIKSAAGM